MAIRKKCPGCGSAVGQKHLGSVEPAEHAVEMRVCDDCADLLIGSKLGYPWRLKLLAALERHYKLKASKRRAVKLDADGLWVG